MLSRIRNHPDRRCSNDGSSDSFPADSCRRLPDSASRIGDPRSDNYSDAGPACSHQLEKLERYPYSEPTDAQHL